MNENPISGTAGEDGGVESASDRQANDGAPRGTKPRQAGGDGDSDATVSEATPLRPEEVAVEAADTRATESVHTPSAIAHGAAAVDSSATSDTSTPGEWRIGQLVAERFRIVRFIGQGGMGKVYLGHDEVLDRAIALKRIPAEILFDDDAREDLRQEANRLLDLAHDNIVRVHTYYDGPTLPLIAMEYIAGPTLKDLLTTRRQRGAVFRVDEVLAIARPVARGLDYAHSKAIVHRDLKPGNLMLSEDPQEPITDPVEVKITDFGISRVVADGTLRHTGRRTGTLPYMSPEQFCGEATKPQSDVYSLACTLYELLSGRPPFFTGDIGYQIMHVVPRPLTAVPHHVNNAILRGLAKSPLDRFESASQLVHALEGKITVSRPREHGRRWRRAATAAAALLLLTVIFFGGIGFGRRQGTSTSGGSPARGSTEPIGALAPEDEAGNGVRFSLDLREKLESRFPRILGPKHALDMPVSATDGMRFQFELEPPADPALRRHFESLSIRCVLKDTGDVEEAEVAVDAATGKRRFAFERLRDGPYVLEPSVRGESIFRDDGFEFRVDLTPPAIEIAPLDPRALIDAGATLLTNSSGASGAEAEREWVTFLDRLEVEIQANEPVEVRYKAYADPSAPALPVGDLRRWALKLDEGENHLQFVAYDLAGNRSREVVQSIWRMALRVRRLETQRVVGDVAEVGGEIEIGSDMPPRLRFFVNGVESLTGAVDPWTGTAKAHGRLSILPFSAEVRLPRASSNEIEVRFDLGDGVVRPFSEPALATLPGVSMGAPRIDIDPVSERTIREFVEISGRVTPYMPTLTLAAVAKGARKRLDLRPDGPNSATFRTQFKLEPNAEQVLQIQPWVFGQELEPAPPAIRIVCDQIPPTLAEPVEFTPVRDGLWWVNIRPSEDLKFLRVQLVSGGQAQPWMEAERQTSRLYRALIALPRRAAEVKVEMTDLAGNPGLERADCPYRGETIGPAPGESAPAPAVGAEADLDEVTASGDVDAAPRNATEPAVGREGVEFRAPFLRRMRLVFRPFGSDRLEMMRTEVPSRVWRDFLIATGRDAETEVATVDAMNYPKVLSEEGELELLDEFVAWFEREAADGFTYAIPTPAQWLSAFTGASDPSYARGQIEEWFRGGRRDNVRFEAHPSVPYGSGVLNEIGKRPENRTPTTELLDMEANAREVVFDGMGYRVIGGSNVETAAELEVACQKTYAFDGAHARMTGLRLLRRPRNLER